MKKITMKMNTINEMLEICQLIKSNRFIEDDLRERLQKILNHDEYQIEFARYGERVPVELFIDFLINYSKLDGDKIENEDLKVRFEHFHHLFENLEMYKEKQHLITEIFSDDILAEKMKIALAGLPNNSTLGEITFLFTIGIGMSFGWPYIDKEGRNFIHFDYIQLLKGFSNEELESFIAHEIHHIGVNALHDNLDLSNINVEEFFYLLFSGEGLAVKYCNNAEGHLSKKINPKESPNIGLDEFSWNYLNNDFENTFETFIQYINMIRKGEINTNEELMKIFQEYWMNAYTDEQDRNQPPELKQARFYSFGNEIWGIIHDVFGKEQVYQLFNELEKFPEIYNSALKQIGKDEYMIPLCV